MNKIKQPAYAKINIGLQVGQKLPTGFHNIKSIFCCVSLCDTLVVKKNKTSTLNLKTKGQDLPKQNTITKAYTAWRATSRLSQGFDVLLKKKIPQQAGLGGGSSDAATFVLMANKLCGIDMQQNQLDQIAQAVGCDVFFFLRQNGAGVNNCAVVQGKGEAVCPIKKRGDLHFLLCMPNVQSSTKNAYTLVDTWQKTHPQNKNLDIKSDTKGIIMSLEKAYNKAPDTWDFFNDFTLPVANEYSIITKIIKELKSLGAAFCDMTGSGSCVFGVFLDKKTAINAKKMLFSKEKSIKTIYCN